MELFISTVRRALLPKVNVSRIAASYFSAKADVAKCFVTLGVPINSDQETVRLAFIELVKKYHPDSKSPYANAVKFQEVEDAYRKLQEKFAKNRFIVDEGLGEYGLYYEEKEGDEVEHPDINHTAPQHRQYLSYEGLGSGTPFERFKQYNVHKAAKAVENVTQYKINKLSEENPECKQVMKRESKKKVKDIRTGFGMDRLVEDLIQESISRGEFDNLTGSGKPLKQTTTENNPYVDFVTHKMNQVLIENGFTPTWITLQKEIRESTEELRKRLFKLRETMGPLPLTEKEDHYWNQITTILSDEVKQINEKIDTYNLLVPLLHQQMLHLNIKKESEKALYKGPYKKVKPVEINKNEEECSRKKKGLRKFLTSIFQ
nr:dnaJ homolog subfamily C member 28 isoform X1 [Halyomorpha halys]